MFDKLLNFHRFDLKITPQTAFLIRSGNDDIEPNKIDMEFVRVETPYGRTVYIPGSSLKGPFRNHVSTLLKGIGKNVCLLQKGSDCILKAREERKKQEKPKKNSFFLDDYKDACYACRMFGSTEFASIVRFEDFFPYRLNDTPEQKAKSIESIEKYSYVRHGVKIDRKTGSASLNMLFDAEAIVGGEFFGTLVMKNPEMWQVAMIFKVIEDINLGLQKIGGMKSRGFGKVKIDIESINVETFSDKITFFDLKNGTSSLQLPVKPSDGLFSKSYKFTGQQIEDYKMVIYKNLKDW
jgi:CRISPR/Cas system CSM-associated protein Csm3 (group 7 of RAMP superfamily)